jgi:LytS/YehU family sensor histidine kinase
VTVTATGIRLMAIWILAFHLYHYAVLQINATKENARLMLVAKESQLSNLSAQLNPHFFFNSLNTVKALAATDPGKARRAIDLLSDLLRTSLYGRDNLLIPLGEELGLVSDYLELEKMRFDNRLRYSISADEDLAGHPLLPLSIQTLAENAVKHGIAKSINGGSILIKIEKDADSILVTVQNPGKLDTTGLAGGLGLKNLGERLALQYGNRASLTVNEIPGNIVSSVMTIPLS